MEILNKIMIRYQNHSHYKLPITMNPLEYGTLIEQIGNKYIIQLNTFNILIINEKDNENFIKLFRKGEFVFEFKDLKISENSFARFIQDQKYTFKNSKLVSTEILSVYGNILIYPLYEDINALLTPLLALFVLYFIDEFTNNEYLMLSANIIKLRKVIK
jgi:hypothetical protein